MLIKIQRFATIAFCLILLGCTSIPAEKPLNTEASATKLFTKDPTSDEFNQFLILHGYEKDNLPLTGWDIDALTLCALFYHTQIEVANQKLSLAKLATQTARLRQPPTINADIAHSDQKNEDLKPWAYGLSLDIPIDINNKRSYKIEKAEKNAELARINVAELAWQLRSQIATNLIAYHQLQAEIQLLTEELAIKSHIASMLKKRLEAGISAKSELSNVSLLVLKLEHQLSSKKAQLKSIQNKLAADVGLTPEKFELISIKPLVIDKTLAQQVAILSKSIESKALQEQALLNRLDLRRQMVKYAVAEADIKLQAAKQIPDITISPGILFEFGDKIWSLGFSSLLNMLQQNKALVKEAQQLRAVEGAAFENLQAEIIANVSQLQAKYFAAKEAVHQANDSLAKQQALVDKMQQQFDAGLISRLDLTRYKQNTLITKQQKIASQFALLTLTNQIEDLMQKPLFSNFLMPSSTYKESNQ